MYKIVRGGVFALVAVSLVSGCIQPVDDAEIAQTPGIEVVSTPPNAGTDGSGGPVQVTPSVSTWPLVEQFVRGRGDVPNNLQVWYDQPRSPDQLQGFSYTNFAGLPCAGFLLTSFTNAQWQPTNGALLCAQQVSFQAVASVSFFATSDGQPYTVVFGRVEDPNVSAVAVVYSDGTNDAASPFFGGFLLLKPGLASVAVVTAIDAQGNTVIANIPQLPAS